MCPFIVDPRLKKKRGRSLPRESGQEQKKRRRLMDYIGVTTKFPWNPGRIRGQTNVLRGLNEVGPFSMRGDESREQSRARKRRDSVIGSSKLLIYLRSTPTR